MTNTSKFLQAVSKDLELGYDPMGESVPSGMVEKLLSTNDYFARKGAKEQEREEIICRLLASGMTVDEISLRLKIRTDEIRNIESINSRNKIPDYKKTYKSREKSRAKKAAATA